MKNKKLCLKHENPINMQCVNVLCVSQSLIYYIYLELKEKSTD